MKQKLLLAVMTGLLVIACAVGFAACGGNKTPISYEEMAGFEFTSTPESCSITGIRDKSVTEIIVPDYVTSIDKGAFKRCRKLTSVIIGNGVTSIGEDAFYNCDSLRSMTIGSGVTSIGYSAFDWCDSLTTVYYGGTETEWNAISIGSNNSYLTSAKRYYYSETQPTTSGKYWHYVDGVPTKWNTTA